MPTLLSRWLAKTDRFWDYLLGGRRPNRKRQAIGVERLEDRLVPDSRPLPSPVIAAGSDLGSAPLVKLFDADTGAVLQTLTPFDDQFRGGVRVAVGDFTHDGYPDVVTAAGVSGGPQVRVFDGKTGQQIPGPLGNFFAYDPSFLGGVQVAAGDVNGDGYTDLVTAADAGGGPHVKVFDGKTGGTLASFFAFEPEFTGGVRLAVGDLTGDGKAELILAAGVGGAPRVRVLDATTLQPIPGPLGDFYAFDTSARGGVYVAAGDVTGDQHSDLVIGAGLGAAPVVKVFDGQGGAVSLTAPAFDPTSLGGVRVATAYVDQDAHADIVAGAGLRMPSRVRTLSGVTGLPLAGPAGDFDPGVGSVAGGVNVAAGNDPIIPPPPPISLAADIQVSSRRAVAGQAVTITSTLTASPGMDSASVMFDWVNTSTSQGWNYSPAATEQTASDTYTYTANGTYNTEVSWAATYAGYAPSGTVMDQAVTVTGLPPLLVPPCPCNCSGQQSIATPGAGSSGNVPVEATNNPVRYADGVASITATDLTADGFGGLWGQSRSWSNNPSYSGGSDNGNGWTVAQQPHLVQDGSSLVLLANATTAYYYDGDGTPDSHGIYPVYAPRFTDTAVITHDGANGIFKLADGSGNLMTFCDFNDGIPGGQRGALQSWANPDGSTLSVYTRDGLGRPTDIRRSVTAGGVTTTESYLTAYLGGGDVNAGEIASVTLRRQVGAGSWSTVRAVGYEYYTSSDTNGSLGDLKRATVTDADGAVLDQTYYRYYTQDTYDANSNQIGYQGGMKYAFGAQAYAQLKAAEGGTDADVDAASDATVSPYADNYFEYDSSHRVTKETASGAGCSACSGGQGTYTYSYTTSSNADGVNSWKTETVETQPDGTTNTVYTNAYGEVMLRVYTDAAGNKWRTFDRYDSSGHVVLEAQPSAVTGYDDSYADLVDYQSGNAVYLDDANGLFDTYDYYASTTATGTSAGGVAGFQERRSLRHGEAGTDIPQEDNTYYQVTAGDATTNPVATDTVYRNADGTGGETTSYSYTFYTGTTQPYLVTTTLPTVTAGENGPGTAVSSTVAYDTDGRPIWTKDAGGFLTYTEYDAATGAVTKTITDVDTTQTGDFSNLPAGWSTPGGGGLHLTTLYEVDSLGRTTKETDPLGRVTYTVYDDPDHEVRTYAGWDDTNHVPTGPTQVIREDRAGRYTESLTMSAAPDVDANGRPTGTEAISNIQSLSRSYQNDAGQVVYTDDYFDVSGLTYSTSTTLGTEGTNFYRTQQGYDDLGRPNRTVSPAGTISRTVYDGQGRKVSEWVGTDDTPATGYWSPTNYAGMAKVREYEYDGGGVGDGNLTKVTEYPGLGDDRVTQTWYDWRDRPVAVKLGVQAAEATDVNRPIFYSEYDNLNEAISTELYDGDGVTLTTTGGVPDRPSASLLRAETQTAYDEQQRAYESRTFSVAPSGGTVSTNALTTDTWFDLRGNVIKTVVPGGLVQKTTYDGAGRATTVYTTDGGLDSTWSDAGNVTGDKVLEQAETQYDADSEPVLTATRQRFHDATGTGPLGTPASGVPARASYTAAYYDLAGRMTASVDVGTNGGSAYTRPSTVPTRSDAVLVTSQTYDAAGQVYEVTDPKGLVTRTLSDALGRATKTIEDYVDGVPSDADDKTTEYTYGPAGMTSLTLDLAGGGVQTTRWVYGVTKTSGSAIDSNDIAAETDWPDPTTGAPSSTQKDTVTVNALGQTVTSSDRNGTAHSLTYDVLGRITSDAVTALGSGVDGAVLRIETAYDGQGNPSLVTSYDAATGGSVVNQVERAYNGLGQMTDEWQAVSGAVSTSTTPEVKYGYSFDPSGTANNSRPTSITYPNGREVDDNYAGLDDSISRLSSLSDASPAVTLEAYSYLGLGTIVERSHPQPGVDLTYIKQSGEADGDAGDQYTGLDRFGRVVDQRWIATSTGTATDRFQYGYDRDSNATYRDNLVNSAFGEVYTYDGLNQIATFQRGTLNSTKDGITGTASRSQSWDTDAAGNFDSVTTDGTAQARTANAQNEVTSVSGATTPTFDAAGNMTGGETGKQFVYDAWNRLVAAKDSSGAVIASYSYDPLGRRVTTTEGGTTTALYYSDQWQVLEERVGGVATTQYVWSPAYVDALVERDRDTNGDGTLDERLYAQQDANFNTTALVNSSGSVVERYAYDPFGAATVYDSGYTVRSGGSAYASTVLFQGFRQDQVTGNYYARMREYSPTLGRPIQVDPLGLIPDANDYRWEGNGSTGRLDPYGLVDEPNFIVSLIPVVGSGWEAVHAFQNGQYWWGAGYTVLAVTDVLLVKSIFTAGGKLVCKGVAKACSREALGEGTLRTVEGIGEDVVWNAQKQGTRIVKINGVWVKEVNPNVGRLRRWWGQKSLDAQAEGLGRLGDMAPRFLYQDGRLIVEDVGPTLGPHDALKHPFRFFETWMNGTGRLGTPFNDIRPWNMGRNGLIFDPAKNPAQQAAEAITLLCGSSYIKYRGRLYKIENGVGIKPVQMQQLDEIPGRNP